MLEKEENPAIRNQINDIMESIIIVKRTEGLTNLTEAMKNAIGSGINELLCTVAEEAFYFFQVNDFEPTNEIVPVMRKVVTVALERGIV